MDNYIGYTPVPCICSGIITSKITNEETYEVSIYEGPLGELNGPIYCTLIYSPGNDNYRQGMFVKVLMTFMFGGPDMTFTDVMTTSNSYILGTFSERSIIAQDVENPMSAKSKDTMRILNPKSNAGIVMYDNGHLSLVTGGSISTVLKPYGHAIDENAHRTMAQNHHRIVSNNSPFYLTQEMFGMYRGANAEDAASRLSEDDVFINYRRFVQQTQSLDKWVSTTEGAFSPFVGANNRGTTVSKSKEVLFSKVINYEDKRLTIEAGEKGEEFLQIRVDDVKVNEKNIATEPGATPAVLGNRLKITISDEGAIDIKTSGKGIPGTNTHGCNIKIDTDGNLTINASGVIELSHGDDDNKINSIKMDPKDGIDIRAVNGVRVNDQEVVLSSYIDWMNKYKATLTRTAAIGAPSPIHPIAIPEFIKGVNLDGLLKGFTSKGKGSPASGIITDNDDFSSV